MPTNSSLASRRVRVEVHSHGKAEVSSRPSSTKAAWAPAGMDADRDRYYTEFAPLVRRLIRQYGEDAEMREDLAGEIYCRFCALLEAFDPTRGVPMRAYIVRQLTLATYTYARQQWRIRNREANWEAEGIPAEQATALDPTCDWLAALSQELIAELLPAALRKLPPQQRKVVISRYFEERSFEEIAERLGIRPATARALLRHGLTNLRKSIRATPHFQTEADD